NLLADDKARYSYDAFNRTTRVETFDGNIQVNRYDAEGLRHEMEENGKLVQFIFNQDREVIAEQNSLGITRYIRSSELIARNTDAARTYYHYVSDEMGSTTHIVDEDGIVLNQDRKSTRLNSSHVSISYAVFCLKIIKDTKSDLM